MYKELQEITQARLAACGIVDDKDDGRGSTEMKHVNEESSEMRGKPITTVTRHEMSKAITSVVIALRVLQSEVRIPYGRSLSMVHSDNRLHDWCRGVSVWSSSILLGKLSSNIMIFEHQHRAAAFV